MLSLETLKNESKFYIRLLLLSVIFIVISRFILMISPVPSGSMENTIRIGDVAIGSRLNTENVNRYDIVTFDFPDNPRITYIKRVIGLPGETVVVRDGNVWIDGEKINSSFTKEVMNDSGDGTYIVPSGCYFMMGDNRNDSYDSRFWKNKYVTKDAITSKTFVIIPLHYIFDFIDKF